MNVNCEQAASQFQQSEIKKQLRERKENTGNQPFDSIKPFRSHRKRVDDEKQSFDIQLVGQIRQNLNEPSFKLRREYNAEGEKDDIKSKLTRFKYDTDGKENDLQLKQGNVTETAKKNKNPTIATKNGFNSIRKNTNKKQLLSSIQNSDRRKEVQSIIFDSKVTKFQGWEDKIVRTFSVCQEVFVDKNLSTFREKVNKVNDEIEAGLSNIEQMLSELKKQKHQKSQVQSKVKTANRLHELQKQFAKRREEARLQEESRNEFKKQMKLSCSKTRQQSIMLDISQPIDQEKQSEAVTIIKPKQLQLKQAEDSVCHSQIKLQGDFGSQIFTFPPQYTTFINRLARQIEKDIEFTAKITQLTKSNQIKLINQIIRSQLKKYSQAEYKIDESFFVIEPSEVDPLDHGNVGWFKKLTENQLQEEAGNVFKQYHHIESHYKSKLQNKISNSVIELFLQELAKFNFTKTSTNNSDSITVGHLLSYLNMRTNNSFRNRSFVKMLKRLGIKSNGYLTVGALQKLIKP